MIFHHKQVLGNLKNNQKGKKIAENILGNILN